MYPLAAGKHVPCKHGKLLHRESASTKLCSSLTMNVPEKKTYLNVDFVMKIIFNVQKNSFYIFYGRSLVLISCCCLFWLNSVPVSDCFKLLPKIRI